jgi:hypothetical protein
VQSLIASRLAISSWLGLAMRESKTLGDGKVTETGETLTSREEGLRPCQSTAGVITEASMVPPNPEVVTVTLSPAFIRLMLTPCATL